VRKIVVPNISAEDVLNLCKKGIGTIDLKNRVEAAVVELSQIATSYQKKGKAGELSEFEPLTRKTDDNTVVTAGLTKKELINLYENYLRKTDKPGRIVYDTLILAAEDKCPYCGGIGRPRNLDHFMPKAVFPQFSTVPVNLIPACRDCNMDGKGQDFAQRPNEQIIHPYLDNECFFEEQWVYAHVISENLCYIDYFVRPPKHWNPINKERVATHFNDFELAKRFSIQAAEELTTLISQRKGFMSQLSSSEFSQYLASFLDSPLFINHWKKIMYQCLAADDWFCSFTF